MTAVFFHCMIGDSGGRGRILSKVPFCRILNDIRCLDGTVDGTVNGKMIVVIFTVLHSRVEFVVTVPFQIPAFQFLDRRIALHVVFFTEALSPWTNT